MIRLSVRARLAAMAALSALLTGTLTSAFAAWALVAQGRADALDRARWISASVEPMALEAILRPGMPDLELALDSRLATLRRDPSVFAVAVVDFRGERVPKTDSAPAPDVRGTGELFVVSGEHVLVAHPVRSGADQVGYIALDVAWPRAQVGWDVLWLGLVTLGVVVAASGLGWVAARPATGDLRAITQAIEQLGRGETWDAPDLRRGTDELGRVGRAISALARRLDDAAVVLATPLPPDETQPAPSLHPRPCHAREILEAAVAEGERDSATVTRDWDLPADDGIVTDPDALVAVLASLVDNAIIHGGGAITLSAFIDPESRELAVAVQDTGPGLSDLAFRHLFRPVPSSHPRGFGVGLATASRQIGALGGRIALDERYRRGTRFVVRVPLLPRETA